MLRLGIVGCLVLSAGPVSAIGWYIPMAEQQIGGFDHIQIRMAPGFEFESLAFSNFFGFTPTWDSEPDAELWQQTFINPSLNLATASGPNIGDGVIYFNIWVEGTPGATQPAFHYQAYNQGTLVSNLDIYNVGPGDEDWILEPGTWLQTTPLTLDPNTFLLGDADRDGDVDIFDILNHWQLNYTGSTGTGMTWEQGDWNGDGAVDIFDILAWQLNYTGPLLGPPLPYTNQTYGDLDLLSFMQTLDALDLGHTAAAPEPSTALLIAGVAIAAALGRRRRHS